MVDGQVWTLLGCACLGVAMAHRTDAGGPAPEWSTVVNNGATMPGSKKFFNSYSQPSMNADGMVVFRGRSKGPGVPARGVYAGHAEGGAVRAVAVVGGEVPQPNNTPTPSGTLAPFREFPSFPRIDAGSQLVATRGQTSPVWTYTLSDGSETRVGTAGIFVEQGGVLRTGASLLGGVLDAVTGAHVFPWYEVPHAPPGTRFDQFPGAPSASGGQMIAFKGNWTDPNSGEGRTGVYVRDVVGRAGMARAMRIADSTMEIPSDGEGASVLFGSTAPPSAADGKVVFLGVDVEEAPTAGGIYLATFADDPVLRPLVAIGGQVPGEFAGVTFARIGEALSFDGRWVAFWGAWGERMVPRLLECPDDGEAEIVAYCHEQYPDGHLVEVPEHQGFFALDIVTGTVLPIAKTGAGIDDMLYWNFSGSPPNAGGGKGGKGGTAEESQEPPRWRSATFVSIEAFSSDSFQAVFKASAAGIDAIYRRVGPFGPEPAPVLSIGAEGGSVDPDAPAGSVVVSLGIEREALRGGRLALTASMLDAVTSESWAGIYATTLRPLGGCTADLNGDGEIGAADIGVLMESWGCAGPCAGDIDGDGRVDGPDLALLLDSWGPCQPGSPGS